MSGLIVLSLRVCDEVFGFVYLLFCLFAFAGSLLFELISWFVVALGWFVCFRFELVWLVLGFDICWLFCLSVVVFYDFGSVVFVVVVCWLVCLILVYVCCIGGLLLFVVCLSVACTLLFWGLYIWFFLCVVNVTFCFVVHLLEFVVAIWFVWVALFVVLFI